MKKYLEKYAVKENKDGTLNLSSTIANLDKNKNSHNLSVNIPKASVNSSGVFNVSSETQGITMTFTTEEK